MQEFPHSYVVKASAGPVGDVRLSSEARDPIISEPPPQFGGSGENWSPETLLVAAIADCFLLSFRAISRVGKLDWRSVQCDVDGTLAPIDRVAQFTHVALSVVVELDAQGDEEKAKKLLERAKKSCLITNSLKAEVTMKMQVVQNDVSPATP